MRSSPEARSLAVIEMAQAGRFAEIRDLFAAPLRPMVSAESLQAAWLAELSRRGPVRAVGAPVSESARHGSAVVKIPVTCERGDFTLLVSVTEAGSLGGLQIAPASAAQPAAPWEPPGYARPEQFDEQELTAVADIATWVTVLRRPSGAGQPGASPPPASRDGTARGARDGDGTAQRL